MMDIRRIDENFAVSPQIQPEDMQRLADEGFTTVICNRPDGEEPGQPPLSDLREAAQTAGIEFHHVPVSGGQFPPAALEEFARIRSEAEGPVFAYCRTGTRSITLETLANPLGLSAEERLERARAAGYDLSALRPHLED